MADDYASYLEACYQGEIFGEAFMGAMAEARSDPEETRKLRALERLERETGALLADALAEAGRTAAPDATQREQALKIGQQMGAAPWADLLGAMRPELVKFVAEFEAAEALAPPGQEALVRHVTAHEQALLDFVDAELAGDGDSLASVEALLSPTQQD